MGNNEEIKEEKSQIFFSDLTSNSNNTQIIPNTAENLREKVSLRISLTNIQKEYNYSLQIFSKNDQADLIALNSNQKLEKTSSIEAILKTSIIINYFFEREQKLLIEITKYTDDGKSQKFNIDTTLGCIMGSRKNTLNLQIPHSAGEKLIITAEKIGQGEEIFFLDFDVKPNKPIDWTEIKNKFIFKLNSGNNPIYKSECISDKGTFNSIKIPSGILKKGIQLIFLDYSKSIVAEVNTTIEEMTKGECIIVQMDKNNYFNVISKSKLKKNLSFIDYLKAGVQIGLSIAIDFTG